MRQRTDSDALNLRRRKADFPEQRFVPEDMMKPVLCALGIIVSIGFGLADGSSASAQSDALRTLRVGDSLPRVPNAFEFLLDAPTGQIVTLDWQGRSLNDRCDVPVQGLTEVATQVTNAEGESLTQIGQVYTPTTPRQVYRLSGSGPYRVATVICGGVVMSLSILDGDAISRLDQPPLSLDTTAQISATTIAPDQLIAFPLNLQQGDVFTVRTSLNDAPNAVSLPTYGAVIRDANGQDVASLFSDRLPYVWNLAAPVYAADQALPYHLELPALGIYVVNNQCRDGSIDCLFFDVQVQRGNTAVEDRGVLNIGSSIQDILPTNEAVLYTLDVAEAQPFTFRFQWSQAAPELRFFNAAPDVADVVTSSVVETAGYNWTMHVQGPPPYTLYLFAEAASYALQIEAADTVAQHEVGRLAPGGILHGIVPPVDDVRDYVALDVDPNTVITLNWGVPQSEFTIVDSTGARMYPSNDHWSAGYAVVDLSQGTPPFVVVMDDARYAGQPFTFTLAEGESPLAF
jgi:hypothetical protein